MPSLIIHTDQSLNNIIEELDFKKIEETLKQVFIKILDAEEDKCQIIWINSRIITSDYKIYCELKFRETDYPVLDISSLPTEKGSKKYMQEI